MTVRSRCPTSSSAGTPCPSWTRWTARAAAVRGAGWPSCAGRRPRASRGSPREPLAPAAAERERRARGRAQDIGRRATRRLEPVRPGARTVDRRAPRDVPVASRCPGKYRRRRRRWHSRLRRAPTQSLYHGTVHGVAADRPARAIRGRVPATVRSPSAATARRHRRVVARGLPGDPEAQSGSSRHSATACSPPSRTDGAPRFDEEPHAALRSVPGGFRDERIRAGDAFAGLRRPAAAARGPRVAARARSCRGRLRGQLRVPGTAIAATCSSSRPSRHGGGDSSAHARAGVRLRDRPAGAARFYFPQTRYVATMG